MAAEFKATGQVQSEQPSDEKKVDSIGIEHV